MKQIHNIGSIFCLLAVAALILNGCASIFKGTREEVMFDSGPGGAEVWVNGAKVGVTPCRIQFKSKEDLKVEFKKEGYETKSYFISGSVGAGWVVLDVLGGLIPVIIDAATGAWYYLDQTNINAVLEKQQSK
jgi:hypothetical protein